MQLHRGCVHQEELGNMTPCDECAKPKMVTIWVVTPHASSDYDEWWGAAETDEDHDAACEYAEERLRDLWDQYDSQDPRVVSVTLQQREVPREDFEGLDS